MTLINKKTICASERNELYYNGSPDPIAILRLNVLNVLNVFKIKLEKIKNKFWDGKNFKKKIKIKKFTKGMIPLVSNIKGIIPL